MSALCTALVITDPVRSYFYLSLSNDEHSFTAVFIHQPPFLMTDSCFYCRFTVFHHQTHFPTTNTHLQPFSSTNLPFQRRTVVFTAVLLFSTTKHAFQRRTVVLTAVLLFSTTKHAFQRWTVVFTAVLLFSTTKLAFQQQTLVYSHFHSPATLSIDKYSFTAVFHISNDEYSFTVIFIHQPPFSTTNTLLQPFSTTIHAFQRQKFFYNCSHPPTSLSIDKYSFTAVFHHHIHSFSPLRLIHQTTNSHIYTLIH